MVSRDQSDLLELQKVRKQGIMANESKVGIKLYKLSLARTFNALIIDY